MARGRRVAGGGLLARALGEPVRAHRGGGCHPGDPAGSNYRHIGVFADRLPGRAIVVSAIDNLVKGSAGQALQNFNLMHGLDETTALEQLPLFPQTGRPLPANAHAGLAADTGDIVAEGDIHLGEYRGGGARIEEVTPAETSPKTSSSSSSKRNVVLLEMSVA